MKKSISILILSLSLWCAMPALAFSCGCFGWCNRNSEETMEETLFEYNNINVVLDISERIADVLSGNKTK